MTNSQPAQSNVGQLQNYFRNHDELSDLHTHLLGMGDDAFWVDRILMNKTVLPTNQEFHNNDTLREELCQLVWNPYKQGFLLGKAVRSIFDKLRETNYPNGLWKELEDLLKEHLPKPQKDKKSDLNQLIRHLQTSIDTISSTQAFSDTDGLNKLLGKLQESIDLSKKTSDDKEHIDKLLFDFKKSTERILPKITGDNTYDLKEQCRKLSKLANDMFLKTTSDDTNLLNKLLEEIKDSIDFMIPKSTSTEVEHPKKLLERLKYLVQRIKSNNTNSSNGSSNENPIDSALSMPKSEDNLTALKDSMERMLDRLTSADAKDLRKRFTDLNAFIYHTLPVQPIFYSMIENNNKFARELRNRGLAFAESFSYDVILQLKDLASGLGVTNRCNEFIQAAVEEKLCFPIIPAPDRPQFRHWIIFNTRAQCFEVVYGITVEELRKLITIDQMAPREASKLARAHIVNTISMCDPQGTDARPIDFHSFQGMFTPEFYPRRFAIKDSIYGQRLDILAHLLDHILYRYSTCRPRVTYCELSVGVGDITRPWVFDVLCSFPSAQMQDTDEQETANSQTPHELRTTTSSNSTINIRFRDLLLCGHFPSLGNAVLKNEESQEKKTTTEFQQKLQVRMPECTYKLLAGFNRQQVKTSYFENREEAINLLNEAPQIAIHLMLNEINKSARDELITEKNDMFYQHIEQLGKVKDSARNNNQFSQWMVGFDFFADEMGFPYCSFVTRNFINYVLKIRKEFNSSFGLRIHCGENVPIVDATAPAYRHFAAHMYIAFRCLRYLQHELEYGIRIGHGIAFQHILDPTLMNTSAHRKSSVLIAEIEHHARHVFKTIAFEVNITSNEYLLGHVVRKGSQKQPPQATVTQRDCPQQPLQLNALLNLHAPIILATDNDGIWPILKCPCREPTHFSLSGECCRAISTEIIQSLEDLETMFENMKTFRFHTNDNKVTMPKADNSILPHDTRVFTVIIHPDIIKFIIGRCIARDQTSGRFYKDFYTVYLLGISTDGNAQNIPNDMLTISKELCSRLAPIAYVSYCAEKSGISPDVDQNQYNIIFNSHPPVQTVLDEWKSVYQQLIDPNIIDQSQCVSTKSRKNVFFSEGPLVAHKDKERPMTDLIHYLQRHYHYCEELHIHAFTRHINIEATVKEIEKQLKRPCHRDFRVDIYSTKDKEQYEDFNLSKKIPSITINHTPLKRTMFRKAKQQQQPQEEQQQPQEEQQEQQNGLYAVCPHASAATAFLHMIGEELSRTANTGNTRSPTDENPGSSVTTDQRSANNTNPAQATNQTQSLNTEPSTPCPDAAHDSHGNNDTPSVSSIVRQKMHQEGLDVHEEEDSSPQKRKNTNESNQTHSKRPKGKKNNKRKEYYGK